MIPKPAGSSSWLGTTVLSCWHTDDSCWLMTAAYSPQICREQLTGTTVIMLMTQLRLLLAHGGSAFPKAAGSSWLGPQCSCCMAQV